MARTRGGRIPVHRVQTSLATLAAKSVRSVDSLTAAGGVTISVDASDDTLEVDPERIEQAVRNLLENAIRHTAQGGVVRLSARRLDGFARFVVEDSGPGFPPDLLAHAFEPFTRGKTETASTTGAGLGLSIVQAIAEAHGGSASAENLPDGARVTVDVRA
jgi:two-component system, OmpR family, sensor kinase